MEFLIFLLYLVLGILFGWFIGDTHQAIREGETHKSWLSWLVLFLGLAYMMVGSWHTHYQWKHRAYDESEYEIVRDTVITNHNGLIDTVTTFKILEK